MNYRLEKYTVKEALAKGYHPKMADRVYRRVPVPSTRKPKGVPRKPSPRGRAELVKRQKKERKRYEG